MSPSSGTAAVMLNSPAQVSSPATVIETVAANDLTRIEPSSAARRYHGLEGLSKPKEEQQEGSRLAISRVKPVVSLTSSPFRNLDSFPADLAILKLHGSGDVGLNNDEEDDNIVCGAVANTTRSVSLRLPEIPIRSKIAILAVHALHGDDPLFAPSRFQRVSSELSLLNMRTYAEHNGYDVIVEDLHTSQICRPAVAQRRAIHWCKVLALEKWLPHYEHILVVDMDALVMNFQLSVEKHLLARLKVEQEKGVRRWGRRGKCRFLLTGDANGVNTGVFVAERSGVSMDLLRDWWNMPRGFHVPFFEQSALHNLLSPMLFPQARLNEADRLGAVCFVEQKFMNAYPPALAEKSEGYTEGDFLVHFAGCGMKDQDLCAKEFAGMFERSVMFAKLANVKKVYEPQGLVVGSNEVDARYKLPFVPSVRDALSRLYHDEKQVGDDDDDQLGWRSTLIPRELTREGVRLAIVVHELLSPEIQRRVQKEAAEQQYSYFTARFPPSASTDKSDSRSKRPTPIVSSIACTSGDDVRRDACLAQGLLDLLPYYDTLVYMSAKANDALVEHVDWTTSTVEYPLHERVASPLHSLVVFDATSSSPIGASDDDGLLHKQGILLLSHSPLVFRLLKCVVNSAQSSMSSLSTFPSASEQSHRLDASGWNFADRCFPRSNHAKQKHQEYKRRAKVTGTSEILVAPPAWAMLFVSSKRRGADDASSVREASPLSPPAPIDRSRSHSYELVLPVAVAVDLCARRQKEGLLRAAVAAGPSQHLPAAPVVVIKTEEDFKRQHEVRAADSENGDGQTHHSNRHVTTGGGDEREEAATDRHLDVAIVVVCPADAWLKEVSFANKKRFAARHKLTLYWTDCSPTSPDKLCSSVRDASRGISRHLRWAKVKAVEQVLRKHDWVLYLEPDVFLTANGAVLSDLIRHLQDQFSLVQSGGRPIDLFLSGMIRHDGITEGADAAKEASGRKPLVNVVVDPAVMLVRNSPRAFQLLADWWSVPSEHWTPSFESSALSFFLSEHSHPASSNPNHAGRSNTSTARERRDGGGGGGGGGVFVLEPTGLTWAIVSPAKDLNAIPPGVAYLGQHGVSEDRAFADGDFAVQFPFCAYRPKAACLSMMKRALGEDAIQ